MRDQVGCVVLSDFNTANFVSYLNADVRRPTLAAEGRMMAGPEAAVVDPAIVGAAPAVLVVWFRAEHVATAMASALEGRTFDIGSARRDVDLFGDAIRELAGRVATVLVASWFMPPAHRGFGMSSLKQNTGASNLVLRMNLRIAERLEDLANVHLLDATRWVTLGGARAFSPRLWYMGKIPYANEVFRHAAQDVKAALRGVGGEARKLIILDLDNTLWGGLVGESGSQMLRLGGHDPAGEAFVDFQQALKALANRGVLLAIASKNDEQIAMEAIMNHPEMVLRPSDFAAHRINWHDKAQNIADLLTDLSLGPQAAVFIDDNPVERARVGNALPDVLVPDWPSSPLMYPSALMRLDCFDTPAVTDEDRSRGHMYLAEAQRAAVRRELGSFDDWLSTLGIHVRAAELSDANCSRATQLLNKTNQLNLSTRRLSSSELRAWAARTDCRVWTFRVADRFGDAGLTGILGLQFEHDSARIVDFVVSCRVIGRRLEETMLHHAVAEARAAGVKALVATYEPTRRNGPCKQFLERCGLSNGDGRTYSWDTGVPYPVPLEVVFELGAD